MKKSTIIQNSLLLCLFFCMGMGNLFAQEDSAVAEKVIKVQYFNQNNSLQYLLVKTKIKTGRKTEPDKNVPLQVFLDSNRFENLIGRITTNDNGEAKVIIPPSLKASWDASPTHKFITVAEGDATTGIDVTVSRIIMDTTTVDSTRNITVKVDQFSHGQWIPAKDVEMKVGIERLGGILTAGDAETYTTDSTGMVTVEFKKLNLPGDTKGYFTLAAKVEDNDTYGNLLIEKKVQWGANLIPDNNFFNQRSLWSTRFRTPIWLLIMAYSIFFSVWGTLAYLIYQIVRIKKLGDKAPAEKPTADPFLKESAHALSVL